MAWSYRQTNGKGFTHQINWPKITILFKRFLRKMWQIFIFEQTVRQDDCNIAPLFSKGKFQRTLPTEIIWSKLSFFLKMFSNFPHTNHHFYHHVRDSGILGGIFPDVSLWELSHTSWLEHLGYFHVNTTVLSCVLPLVWLQPKIYKKLTLSVKFVKTCR